MNNDNIFSKIEILLGCQDNIISVANNVVEKGILRRCSDEELNKKYSSITYSIMDLCDRLEKDRVSLSDNTNTNVKLLREYMIYYEAIKKECFNRGILNCYSNNMNVAKTM